MTELNVLPLESYDILIDMDCMEKIWSLINCKIKTINNIDEEGKRGNSWNNKTLIAEADNNFPIGQVYLESMPNLCNTSRVLQF